MIKFTFAVIVGSSINTEVFADPIPTTLAAGALVDVALLLPTVVSADTKTTVACSTQTGGGIRFRHFEDLVLNLRISRCL